MSCPEVLVIPESTEVNVPISISIESDADIVTARRHGRMLAVVLGFSSSDATVVAAAISELARNIILYAKRGEILLNAVRHPDRAAVIIAARDQGMGIVDLARAVQDGYSTSGRSGIGLSGVRRLMDEFHIVSEVGKGTVVTVTKWQRGRSDARTAISAGQFSKPRSTEGASHEAPPILRGISSA
jgi:serine/threonine-protein kinase RsbT